MYLYIISIYLLVLIRLSSYIKYVLPTTNTLVLLNTSSQTRFNPYGVIFSGYCNLQWYYIDWFMLTTSILFYNKTNALVVGKTYLIYDQTIRYEEH
jgi:hypothetical protein